MITQKYLIKLRLTWLVLFLQMGCYYRQEKYIVVLSQMILMMSSN